MEGFGSGTAANAPMVAFAGIRLRSAMAELASLLSFKSAIFIYN